PTFRWSLHTTTRCRKALAKQSSRRRLARTPGGAINRAPTVRRDKELKMKWVDGVVQGPDLLASCRIIHPHLAQEPKSEGRPTGYCNAIFYGVSSMKTGSGNKTRECYR